MEQQIRSLAPTGRVILNSVNDLDFHFQNTHLWVQPDSSGNRCHTSSIATPGQPSSSESDDSTSLPPQPIFCTSLSFQISSITLDLSRPRHLSSHSTRNHQHDQWKAKTRHSQWGSFNRLQNNIPYLRLGHTSVLWVETWHTKQWPIVKNRLTSSWDRQDKASNV